MNGVGEVAEELGKNQKPKQEKPRENGGECLGKLYPKRRGGKNKKKRAPTESGG